MTPQTKRELEETIYFNGVRLSPVGCGIRMPQWVAKKWLLENKSIIVNATVFYLQIKNLGLGVCEVAKAPLIIRSTKMVKKFLD